MAASQQAPAAAKVDDEPQPALDDRWLRSLSIDLFGRPPYGADREQWLGKSRSEYVSYALGTEEAWRHWLDEQLYYFMLIDVFRPVGTSLDKLPALLAARKLTPRDALHRIALSTSFDLRNPGADTFVTVVMEQFCGIAVQRSKRELEIGKGAYDGEPGLFLGSRASSQSDVVRIAATHSDAARHFVEREYARYMRVPIGKRSRVRTGKRLHRSPGAYADVLAEWFASEAYARRVESGAPLSNRIWVRAVFIDLGGSLPGDKDAEALRSALDGLGDSAPLRSAIVRMLLSARGTAPPRSSEISDHEAWVLDTFTRLLGRAPSPEEKAAFVAAARGQPDGPEVVIYTLVTSEEYERS